MSTPFAIDSRFIAQHEDFLRRLARGLVGSDGAAVDDAVQDVWVRALKTPPNASPRAYLAATLRNGIARLRSRERARAEVERSAARAERTGGDARASAAGLLDGDIDRRLALHEELARALRALPEEQRRALYLRYSEDLSPAEIAARTGEPLGTVKTRLARGLVALRADLDARHGGERANWAVALSLAVGRSGAPRAPLAWGALEVLGVAAVTLVAAVLFFAWLRAARDMSADSSRDVDLAMAPWPITDAPPAAESVGAPAPSAGAPRSAPNHATNAVGATAQEPPLDPGASTVRLALIDESGAPIAGAVVRALASEGGSNLLADWGAVPASLERVATSSVQGVATLELPAHPALRWKLDIDAEGHGGLALSVPSLVPRLPLDMGSVRLRPEAILEIEVRAPGGDLCLTSGDISVRVECRPGDRQQEYWMRDVTPHEGRAVFRGVPAGTAVVMAVHGSSSATELTTNAGVTHAVTLALNALPDLEQVRVRIAKVFGATPAATELSLVLADGSVRVPEAPQPSAPAANAVYVWRDVPEGEHTLRVVAPGFDPYTAPAPRGSGHSVRLVPSSGVRLAFVDGAGTPVDCLALVEHIGPAANAYWRTLTERPTLLPAVALPAGDHRLRVSCERFAAVEVAVEALALDEWREISVTIAPSRLVTGRVVGALGQAVPGALVQVLRPASVGDGVLSSVETSNAGSNGPSPTCRADQRQELAHAYSDAAGRFRLYTACSGALVLRAQRFGHAFGDMDFGVRIQARRSASSTGVHATELALGSAHEHLGVELILDAGVMVAGRLVGAVHAPFDDLAVVLVRESIVDAGPQHAYASVAIDDVVVGETGAFMLGPVAPARYVLFVRPAVQMQSGVFMVLGDSLVELARLEVPGAGLEGLEVPLDGLVAPNVEVRVRTSLPRGPGPSGDTAATLLLSTRVLASMGRNGALAHLVAPEPGGWGAGETPATTAIGRLRLGPEPRWRLWVNDRARGWIVQRDVDLTTQTGPIEIEVELADAAVTFVDALGVPLEGREVSIAQSLNLALGPAAAFSNTGQSTDSNGRVELRLPPGDVELTLHQKLSQVRVGPILWPPPAGTVLTVPD